MGRILQALVLSAAASFGGCYSHSLRDAPNPDFNTVQNEDWNQYISQISDRCERSKIDTIDLNENEFSRYFDWLNELTGKNFAMKNFNIVPSNPLMAFFDAGPLMFFARKGTFVYGTIYVHNECLSLHGIAHEYGHFTDSHLSSASYFFSRRSKIRSEAVAESFAHYVGLELMRLGNRINFSDESENKTRNTILELAECQTLEGVLDLETYQSARCLAFILMNEFREMGKVWYYLAITGDSTVYANIERLIAVNGGVAAAIRNGASLANQEKEKYINLQ